MSTTATCRITVVVDGPPTPAWQAVALEGLREAESLEVGAVRMHRAPSPSPTRRARLALERRWYGLRSDGLAAASEPVATQALGGGAAPELVVWLAEGAEPDAQGAAAPVLRLHHDGGATLADAFAAAVLRDAATVHSQARWSDGAREVVVAETWSGVRPFSAAASASLAAYKLAALIVRAAVATSSDAAPAPAEVVATAETAPARLSRGGEARLLLLTAVRALTVAARRLLYKRPWEVWMRPREADPTAGWDSGTRLDLPWQPGWLYADPMLFERDGLHHLFVEAVAPGSSRGVIAHLALDDSGRALGPPEVVLEHEVHLSYPFVFEHDGAIYLIPETSAARRLELWRAEEFPRRWRREAVLLDDVEAVDATVFTADGRLWMAVGIAAPGAGTLDELHLLWAAGGDPRGPWTPHPANPVVSDARCARPGGPVIERDGLLVRPGQDGSRRYGGAVTFRVIDELSTERYREHEVGRLTPIGRGARAAHSYAADSRFEAIDVRRRQLRLHRFLGR